MDKFLIGIIVLISGLVKLVGINQSLWLDEAISAQVARNYDWWDIVNKFSVNDFHPPFYYMFLKLWTNIFGFSEISLRLPSVIFSLITIIVVYKITRLISNKKNAVWAAVFTGFNPLLIYYAQEARMYSMVVLWLTLAVYFALRLDKKLNKGNLAGFNIFCFLSFITFYGSIFLIAAIDVVWLIRKKIKLLLLANIGIVLAIDVMGPLLYKQITLSRTLLIDVKNWSSVLGKVNLKNIVLIPIKFTSGRISYMPKIIYFGIAAIWAGVVFWTMIRGALRKPKLFFFFALTLILALIFSIFSPLLQYFRFLYLVPIMAILIAIGLDKEKTRLIYGIVFVIFAALYVCNSDMYREDWKGLARNLKDTQTVYMIESASDPIKYYLPEMKIKDIKKTTPTESLITVIPYVEEIHGFDHKKVLEEMGYQEIEAKSYREVSVEKWFK